MTILTDFHVHSNFSDGKFSIPEIVDLYGRNGFGAIAITDHICEEQTFLGKAAAYLGRSLTQATFPLYQQILETEIERAWSVYRMILIPGMELTKNSLVCHRAAHVVALGVTNWISPDQNLKEISTAINEQGGLSIAAHPLDPGPVNDSSYYLWKSRDELRSSFDAWEITNGPRLLEAVMKSDLPKIATSDFHHMGHFSAWRTEVDAEKNRDAIFEGIRKQKIRMKYFGKVETNVVDGSRAWNPLDSEYNPNPVWNVA